MVPIGRPAVIVGISGTTYADRAPTVVARVDNQLRHSPACVLVDTAGSFDLRDGMSAAALLAVAEANADARRAAGYRAVIVATVPPAVIFDAGDEIQRAAYNAALRTSLHFEAVIDFDTAPHLADFNDATYYNADKTHWTAAGAAAAAAVAAPIIAGVLAGL